MNFAEVIKGLQEGKNYTRYSAPHFYGKVISMQIPADIPSEVIPKMTSLNDGIKAHLSTIGDCQIHYRNQVLIINQVDGQPNTATYFIPTWEDIFADDWQVV